MKNNRKFYTTGLFKFLLIIITLASFGFHHYISKKMEIQKMKEVLMYSREQALKQIEEDKIKAKNIEFNEQTEEEKEEKGGDTKKISTSDIIIDGLFEISKKDYYKTKDKLFQEKVQAIQENKYENKLKEKFKKGIEILEEEITAIDPDGLNLEKIISNPAQIIKQMVADAKNDKDVNKLGEATSEIMKSYNKKVKNKNFDLNRKIKLNDIVILDVNMNLDSNPKLKQAIEDSNADIDKLLVEYPQIEKLINFSLKNKRIDFKIKKEYLSSRMIVKIGKETNIDRKLIGKTINSTTKVTQFDQITDYQNDLLANMTAQYKKNIEFYRQITGDLNYKFPDILSELSYTSDVKVVDIVDDSIVNKYNLKKTMTNTDDLVPNIKESHEREQRIMNRIKQL